MSQMSKGSKIVFITCLVLSLCCFVAFFIFNGKGKTSVVVDDNPNENQGNQNEGENNDTSNSLVGVWNLEYQLESTEGVTIAYHLTLELKEDGSFNHSGNYTNADGDTIEVNYYGEYAVDYDNNTINITVNDGIEESLVFVKDDIIFSLNDNILTINDLPYTKVETNNSEEDNTSGNNDEETNPIVGTWYYYVDEIKLDDTYFVFEANGTGKNVISGVEIIFTYRIEGDSLFLKNGTNSEKENTFTIVDNILTINGGAAVGTPYIRGE